MESATCLFAKRLLQGACVLRPELAADLNDGMLQVSEIYSFNKDIELIVIQYWNGVHFMLPGSRTLSMRSLNHNAALPTARPEPSVAPNRSEQSLIAFAMRVQQARVKLEEARGFVIDIDGTLVAGERMLPGALALLEYVEGRYAIVSNNARYVHHARTQAFTDWIEGRSRAHRVGLGAGRAFRCAELSRSTHSDRGQFDARAFRRAAGM